MHIEHPTLTLAPSYLRDDHFFGLTQTMTSVKALVLRGWVPGLEEAMQTTHFSTEEFTRLD